MSSFFNLPPGVDITSRPKPFHAYVPEDELRQFHQLLQLSPIGPETWWNYDSHPNLGIARDWLTQAKETWLKSFDWRQTENRINALPNFRSTIELQGQEHHIHFAALFSAREDAVPIMFLHGWPGCFLEFLPIMELLSSRYSPESLPYHVVVPSLPDYGFSTREQRDTEMTLEIAAQYLHLLMLQLGFAGGYVVQGGDVGSGLAEIMATTFDACKAIHLNTMLRPWGIPGTLWVGSTPEEQAQTACIRTTMDNVGSHVVIQAARPATIGLALSSSPLALLSWIGEKFIDWSDSREPLSLDTILALTTFYWFTRTLPRSIYPYRQFGAWVSDRASRIDDTTHAKATLESTEKPFGFAAFPCELATPPQTMVQRIFPSLVTYKMHQVGGHFAALEQPEAFLNHVEEFIQIIKPVFHG